MSKPLCFVPGPFVPLSRYVQAGGHEPVTIPVSRAVAEYLRRHHSILKLACQRSGEVTYLNAKWSTLYEDTVEVEAESAGNSNTAEGVFVLVSPLLTNMFPVVSHWDNHSAEGGGRFRYGGTDGIGKLRMDEAGSRLFPSM